MAFKWNVNNMKQQNMIIAAVVIIIAIAAGGWYAYDQGWIDIDWFDSGDTVTFNAAEYQADREMYTDMVGIDFTTVTYINVDFESLNDGDTLLFEDVISSLYYYDDESSQPYTTDVYFEFPNNFFKAFRLSGDLRDEYSVGDTVRITLNIKHIVDDIPLPSPYAGTLSVDVETFEEMWKSESYYNDNALLVAFDLGVMSSDCIEKL